MIAIAAARLALADCCLRLDDVAAARMAFARVARTGSMAGLARVELLRIALVTGDRAAVDALVAEVRADAARPRSNGLEGEQFERLLALGSAALATPSGAVSPGNDPSAAGRMVAVTRAAATTDSQRARAEAWSQAAGADAAAGAPAGDAAAMRSLRRLAADRPKLRVVGQQIAILERIRQQERRGL